MELIECFDTFDVVEYARLMLEKYYKHDQYISRYLTGFFFQISIKLNKESAVALKAAFPIIATILDREASDYEIK